MTKVEQRLASIPAHLPANERLEMALDICAARPGHLEPDYPSFRRWVVPRLNAEHGTLWDGLKSGRVSTLRQAVLLRAVILGKQIKKGTRLSRADRNKFRLLDRLHGDDPRTKEVLKTAIETDEVPKVLTEGLANASPAMLRQRLFIAMEMGKANDAAFIMGRLDESTLHDGEHDYLHALIRFKSGELAEAARLAGRVAPTAIDGPYAAYIAARAYAMLGDVEAARNAAAAAQPAMSPCHWLHLAELTCWHGDLARVERLSEGLADIKRLVAKPEDEGYGDWAKFHVRVLLGLFERRTDIIDALAADGGSPPEEPAQVVMELFRTDDVLKRAEVAYMIDLAKRGNAGPAGLIDLLIPVVLDDRDAYCLAFEVLYRTGEYGHFMKQFAVHWQTPESNFVRDPDLLILALEVAVIEDSPLTADIRAALEQAANLDEHGLKTRAKRRHAAQRLSPMSRQSFLGACAALDRAVDGNLIWQDAGLIALGLFRVLEIEINEYLIRPMARGLDLDAMRRQAAGLGERERSWTARIDLLERIVKDRRQGLMFGQIRELLDLALAENRPDEAGLRQHLRVGLEGQLTEAGRPALGARLLHDIIHQDHVHSFRNPPAHGHYLRLTDAQRAEQYVSGALDKLFLWFAAYAAP